ncbi:MAG TPA: CHC2 zinc finger domain-containing protein [Candidatus Obscuribacter sp.]|nr:hypothetical protein [Candidatus Obscuribacter sp.]HMW90146.1 CHC2 zinc finger domain-containing protein [Candidatus Obscuribacter sp.]HMX46241.1 CHC2 zinc finger domain-containing protein [Candidatus Obscuribacter sp.]HND06229.1 CHC2 zinc finger domain-containing protein [Candidatus Obscuribacter sp.]HND68711.1 CHC2 zinc finger domain-containing protein [Candidatus Obscuribacter sp.]
MLNIFGEDGRLRTLAIICTELEGPNAEEDIRRREFSLRQACKDQGFELDGAYIQEAFDRNIWPFKALKLALMEKVSVLVVESLEIVATHEKAVKDLPAELAAQSKSLYSILDARLFYPEDEDFSSLLRVAYELGSGTQRNTINISADLVSAVRAKVRLITLVLDETSFEAQENTTQNKSPLTYLGFCPFHESNAKSFLIDSSGDYFMCRECLASGDVFSFVERAQGVRFEAAVHYLAKEFNIHCRG